MIKWLLPLSFLISSSIAEHNLNPIVNTPNGKYQGSTLTTRLGKPIYSFRGIRYAQPPINELRFQPPVAIGNHDDIYDAQKDGPVCPQPPEECDDPSSEDCLILNVYSTKLPDADSNPKRPVIMFIHHGGFYGGSGKSNWAGPQYLLDQDIVLVTFNYRLGALGFLSTGEKEAPGNNGLKDQVMAMKWVKKNIEAFGGDPNLVTLFGYSAGSMSVMLHLMSPMSKSLFHRAVMGSASPLSQYPSGTNQIDVAKRLARVLGCPDDSSINIVNCLKGKSAEEIGGSLEKLKEFGKQPVLVWKPVIEPDFGQERFLIDHPMKLALQGRFQKMPLLAGITTDEFGRNAVGMIRNKTSLEELDKKWYKYAPIVFLYERDTAKSKAISKALKFSYFENGIIDNSSFISLSELFADSQTGWGMNRAVKLVAANNTGSVYYYKFSYQGKYSHYYYPESNKTSPFGVVHHDDLIYLFYIPMLFPMFGNTTNPECKMVEKMTTLYANFAKTGKPIPEIREELDSANWEPFDLKSEKYMDIGDTLKMSSKLFAKRYAVWEELFPYSLYDNPVNVTY